MNSAQGLGFSEEVALSEVSFKLILPFAFGFKKHRCSNRAHALLCADDINVMLDSFE